METKKITPKVFIDRVLGGTAIGIIVGLIPNAVLAAILKMFGTNPFAVHLGQAAIIFQLGTPLIIGTLIAQKFGFDGMKMTVVGGAAFVGSGVIKYFPALNKTGAYVGAGTGDIINTMLTAAIAVGLILLIGDKFGSVAIVLTPIVVGTGAGLIGFYMYPYVTAITSAIGNVINTFTELQPVLMCILIACSFAVLIISPISTVAIALGAMKMMMPNLFRRPIILVPCFFTAIISAVPVALMSISGSPASGGFGLVGLVGPLASIEKGLGVVAALLAWLVIPVIASLVGQFLFEKVFKLYDRKDVFEFLG